MSRRRRRPASNALRVAREDWHAHVDGCRQCQRALHTSGDLCVDGVSLYTTYRRRQRTEQLVRGGRLAL